jgi:hypothetical protein
MPYKQALELWYVGHQSLATDLKIIALTAVALIIPKSCLHENAFSGLPPWPVPDASPPHEAAGTAQPVGLSGPGAAMLQ